MKFLVYVPGLRGPEAQLWHDDCTDGNGKSKIVLQRYEIKPSDSEDLDWLKVRYPFKEESIDPKI